MITIEKILALIDPAAEAHYRIGEGRMLSHRIFVRAEACWMRVHFPTVAALAIRDQDIRPGEVRWVTIAMLGDVKAGEADLTVLKGTYGIAVDAGIFNGVGEIVGTWEPRRFSTEPFRDGRG